jgi:GNAT superfamily N-acetyltransferase
MNAGEIIFREALITDIRGIQRVRNAVQENRLSNPALVSDKDCEAFLVDRGKGWIALYDNDVVGFSIADMRDNNVWALFVDPSFEKKGIGKELQRLMLDWYFTQTNKTFGLAPRRAQGRNSSTILQVGPAMVCTELKK